MSPVVTTSCTATHDIIHMHTSTGFDYNNHLSEHLFVDTGEEIPGSHAGVECLNLTEHARLLFRRAILSFTPICGAEFPLSPQQHVVLRCHLMKDNYHKL